MKMPLTRGDRWTGEGDRVHPGDAAMFIVAIVGFAVLFVCGIL